MASASIEVVADPRAERRERILRDRRVGGAPGGVLPDDDNNMTSRIDRCRIFLPDATRGVDRLYPS